MFLAGCSGDETGGGGQSATDVPPPEIALAVADGSADVSPVVPLEISVTDGELADVQVVDGDGDEVAGDVADAEGAPGTQVWTPETPLAYGTSYTLTTTATNADGEETKACAGCSP